MKVWQCTRCGNSIDKGILASMGGEPTECEVCGNDDFDEPVTMGKTHSLLDQVLP